MCWHKGGGCNKYSLPSVNYFLVVFPSLSSVLPVLVEGVGDELGVKWDVWKAIAVFDSTDHSRPRETVAASKLGLTSLHR